MTEAAKSTYNNDKNTETGNDNKTLKEIVSEVTEQELSRFPDDTVTVEQLKAMAEKQSVRLKRRRSRIIAAAAVFFVALAGVLIAFGDFPVNVEADKNAPEEIVTEDGVVIEDGGWGSSSEDIIETSDWDEVRLLQKKYEDILVPGYVPDRFSFEKLSVEKITDDDVLCIFTFSSNRDIDKIEIHEYFVSNMVEAFNIDEVDYVINCNIGEVYIQSVENEKKATIRMDDSAVINIWGNLDDKEIQMIVNSLNN